MIGTVQDGWRQRRGDPKGGTHLKAADALVTVLQLALQAPDLVLQVIMLIVWMAT